MSYDYDVIIYDPLGLACTGTTYRHGGLGGSEFEYILLAEGLAENGFKVAVINNFNFHCFEYGVMYYPLHHLEMVKSISCKTLLVLRTSNVPTNKIDFDHLKIWLTDLPNEHSVAMISQWVSPGRGGQAICVSKWQRDLFPANWQFSYVHNMIPDWVYNQDPVAKNPQKYIYGSAALKGLEQTVSVWEELKKNGKSSYFFKKAELYVATPGYDAVKKEQLDKAKVHLLGSMPFHLLVQEMKTSSYWFFVNALPETFCIVGALAEACGVLPQVLTLEDPGALPEVLSNNKFVTSDKDVFIENLIKTAKERPPPLPPKDYRVSTILPKWIKELELL